MASAAVGAVGGIISAQTQADTARRQAESNERIAQQNIAFQQGIYDQNVARVDPWVQYGATQRNALSNLMPSLTEQYDMAKYQAGPKYQNTMAQTDRERNALQAKSSASGMYGSGTMANQLQTNAAYLANQGYDQGLQNYERTNEGIYNKLHTGSLTGLQAASSQNAAGTNLGSQVGSAYNNLANNQSAAIGNEGAAWSGMANNLTNIAGGNINAYNQQQMLNKGDSMETGIANYFKDMFGSNPQQSAYAPSFDVSSLYNRGTMPPAYGGNNLAQGNWSGNQAYNFLGGL